MPDRPPAQTRHPELSVVLLPDRRWSEQAPLWQRAEQLGFATAYTYDHLSWRSLRDGPWLGAIPLLTAAAGVTDRIGLGTLVTSPNFREPVLLAKDVMTLDDVSRGRVRLGIGAGGSGFDATVLARTPRAPWSPPERADRFAEFVELLDLLLTEPAGVTWEGRHFAAHEARTLPGCVQQPRVPFLIAATGPRGLRLAARFGQGWVTYGHPRLAGEQTPAQCLATARDQLDALASACAAQGRDPASLRRVLLTGSTREPWLESVTAFEELYGHYAELGFDEIVLHWPRESEPYRASRDVFERIAPAFAPRTP